METMFVDAPSRAAHYSAALSIGWLRWDYGREYNRSTSTATRRTKTPSSFPIQQPSGFAAVRGKLRVRSPEIKHHSVNPLRIYATPDRWCWVRQNPPACCVLS